MVRQTPNHGWDVMEASDERYADIFDQLINQIDESVSIKGPIAERPEAGREGRLYISTDESPPLLYYDDGNQWGGIKGQLNVPDNVAEIDAEEEIQAKWHFLESLDADIDGKAASADNAEIAENAETAQNLGNRGPQEYALREEDEEIQGEWNFAELVNLAGGLDVQEGTIDLPVFNGEDPDNPAPGSMWFREDQQPTS